MKLSANDCEGQRVVYDIVEKTSTHHWSRIPWVVVEKITTRQREDSGIVVEKV